MLGKSTDSPRAAQTLLLCFITYLTAYVLRTNYSSALPLILQQLDFTETELGAVGSAFFIAYAVGQLVNGFIADAVNPSKFIILALIGSAVMNASMAFCDRLWMLMIVWACNGYFQSIFWGCLQRILSLRCSPEKRTMVATVMSASMVAGFVISWVVLRNLLHSWQTFFLYPALMGMILLAVWFPVSRKNSMPEGASRKISLTGIRTAMQLIVEKKLYVVCGICVCLGFIKESISVWGPTMMADMLGLDLQTSSVILFIIPLGNLGGIFWAKFLADRKRFSTLQTLFPLFGALFAASMLMLIAKQNTLLLTAAMIVIVSAMSYGCNSVLLSMVPLLYTRYGIVSTLIGFFDFSSYIGASVSSVVAGALISSQNWDLLPLLWLCFAAAALTITALAQKLSKQS